MPDIKNDKLILANWAKTPAAYVGMATYIKALPEVDRNATVGFEQRTNPLDYYKTLKRPVATEPKAAAKPEVMQYTPRKAEPKLASLEQEPKTEKLPGSALRDTIDKDLEVLKAAEQRILEFHYKQAEKELDALLKHSSKMSLEAAAKAPKAKDEAPAPKPAAKAPEPVQEPVVAVVTASPIVTEVAKIEPAKQEEKAAAKPLAKEEEKQAEPPKPVAAKPAVPPAPPKLFPKVPVVEEKKEPKVQQPPKAPPVIRQTRAQQLRDGAVNKQYGEDIEAVHEHKHQRDEHLKKFRADNMPPATRAPLGSIQINGIEFDASKLSSNLQMKTQTAPGRG